MKKVFLYSLILPLLFFSCKKEQTQPNNSVAINTGKKYFKVKFNLSGFTATIGNSNILQTNSLVTNASQDTSSSDSLTTLYYQVYNSSGVALHQVYTNTTTTGTFSPITDSLQAGSYTVVLVAGKQNLQYTSATGTNITADQVSYYTNPLAVDTGTNWHDTFYKKLSITIGGADTTVNATLTRIVSQLEVDIQDAIPAGAHSLILGISNGVTAIYANGNVILGGFSYTAYIPPTAIGTKNFQLYDILVPNPDSAMTVEITSYDNSGNLIADKIVPNVNCQANERTVLTGILYGAPTGNSLSLGNQWVATPYRSISFSSKKKIITH